jgi:hypothetical protein
MIMYTHIYIHSYLYTLRKAIGLDMRKLNILPLRDSNISWGIDMDSIASNIELANIWHTDLYLIISNSSSNGLRSPIH